MEKILALKEDLFRYKEQLKDRSASTAFVTLRHLASVPFIYGMAVPLLLFHLFIEIYHRVCFYLFGITYVNYKEHFHFDRHDVNHLSTLQKFNCIYCEYGNGLASYAKEIIGKTEAYWCPIKHKQWVQSPHGEYKWFMEYTQSCDFKKRREEVRKRLS